MKNLFVVLSVCLFSTQSVLALPTNPTGVPMEMANKERTLKHKTCNVYLPTNSSFRSWADITKYYIEKDYLPIEMDVLKLAFKIQADDLFSEISISLRSEPGVIFDTNSCIIHGSLQRVETKDPFSSAMLYSQTGVETDWNNTGSYECDDAAEDAFEDLPRCIVTP